MGYDNLIHSCWRLSLVRSLQLWKVGCCLLFYWECKDVIIIIIIIINIVQMHNSPLSWRGVVVFGSHRQSRTKLLSSGARLILKQPTYPPLPPFSLLIPEIRLPNCVLAVFINRCFTTNVDASLHILYSFISLLNDFVDLVCFY